MTTRYLANFVVQEREIEVEDFHILAFTHRLLEVNQIGWLHIAPDDQKDRLRALKAHFDFDELMYISTCNRVEFIIRSSATVDAEKVGEIISTLFPDYDNAKVDLFANSAEIYKGASAVEHLIKVTSSVDSMIIGEREIITQVRKAFQDCKGYGITGDGIRLMIRFTIETAKKVYTETNIAQRPVSVVSLAYHTLKGKDVPLDARFLVVGAGVTNTNMTRFLKKHGFTNFAVFNRTFSKAEHLANQLKGTPYPLEQLAGYDQGFDVLITCTGAARSIIDEPMYSQLLQGDESSKIIIDLAIPSDMDQSVIDHHVIDYISVDFLQKISSKNLEKRAREIIHVEEIIQDAVEDYNVMFKERQVELAMREVPEKVKEIKSTALDHVFARDLEELDDNSRETMERIMDYMEKKYMSMPMKMAKEILLKK
ncbi:MAG: glutamyl-tRNA reductase [Bacteroidota bacterium]